MDLGIYLIRYRTFPIDMLLEHSEQLDTEYGAWRHRIFLQKTRRNQGYRGCSTRFQVYYGKQYYVITLHRGYYVTLVSNNPC